MTPAALRAYAVAAGGLRLRVRAFLLPRTTAPVEPAAGFHDAPALWWFDCGEGTEALAVACLSSMDWSLPVFRRFMPSRDSPKAYGFRLPPDTHTTCNLADILGLPRGLVTVVGNFDTFTACSCGPNPFRRRRTKRQWPPLR